MPDEFLERDDVNSYHSTISFPRKYSKSFVEAVCEGMKTKLSDAIEELDGEEYLFVASITVISVFPAKK